MARWRMVIEAILDLVVKLGSSRKSEFFQARGIKAIFCILCDTEYFFLRRMGETYRKAHSMMQYIHILVGKGNDRVSVAHFIVSHGSRTISNASFVGLGPFHEATVFTTVSGTPRLLVFPLIWYSYGTL